MSVEAIRGPTVVLCRSATKNKKFHQVRNYVFEKTAILLFSLITPQLNYQSNSIVWGGHFLNQPEIMIISRRSAAKHISMEPYRNSFLESFVVAVLCCAGPQLESTSIAVYSTMEAGDLFSQDFSPSERPCRNSFRNYAATQTGPGSSGEADLLPCKGCLGGQWWRPNA